MSQDSSPSHCFAYDPTSPVHRSEKRAFWVFRMATYFILACAAGIFLTIFVRGSATVFTTEFPFVNVEFLTERPQTLYVFEYEGQKYELPDSRYRVFMEEHGQPSVDAKTYAYSGGGIFPAIVGTILLTIGAMSIALTIGVLSAIYLSEYAKDGPLIRLIRLSIVNLAGVPSIVFGLFGFGMFVLYFGWDVSLLAGCFTLAFMVLPIIIASSEEALRAVPQGFREASLALGATKWQSIRTNVLPYAMSGILTSSVLGIARVAGETAPIMFTAAYAIRDELPWAPIAEGLSEGVGATFEGIHSFFFQGVMALPYHIYVVSAKIPNNEYTERMQYGTAFVFLVIVGCIALTSILLRMRSRKLYKW